MRKKFIGHARQQALDQLLTEWLPGGPPVGILDGFPGTGKSELASELAAASGWLSVRVQPGNETGLETEDLFLDLAIDLKANGIADVADEIERGDQARAAGALRSVVRQRRILVIIDEAQRGFDAGSARPAAVLRGAIQQLGDSLEAEGRLLIISNRLVEQARWSEKTERIRLPALTEEEAVQLLSLLLSKGRIADSIPMDRRLDLVRCLGCNPRAIGTLITCLRFETLDELISSIPGAWELRDVEVSPLLVTQLERELLSHALPKIDPALGKFLRWLSVHRRPFRVDALAQFDTGVSSAEALLKRLVENFLLDRRGGQYTTHAIAREISAHRLREESSEWKQAHNLAANYYLRPFKAHQIVGSENLAPSFAELRYHLYHTGRMAELDEASQRLSSHLGRQFTVGTPVPEPGESLDQRISLLRALLPNAGTKTLAYYFARCLERRRAPGDLEEALERAREVSQGTSIAEMWLFLLDLENELGGIEAVDRTLPAALRQTASQEYVYLRGAELLEQAGRIPDAIVLLESGVAAALPERAYGLYWKWAELLHKQKREKEALAVLDRGIKAVPPGKNLASLYEYAAEILVRGGRSDEAERLLREGLAAIPVGKFGRTIVGEAALRVASQTGIESIEKWLAGTDELALEAPLQVLGRCLILRLQGDWLGVVSEAQAGLKLPSHLSCLAPLLVEARAVIASVAAVPRVAMKSEEPPRVNVLVVATEWDSAHGGLSTFNRQLCVALSRAGVGVSCYVPEASEEEQRRAKELGVGLLTSTLIEDVEPKACLLNPPSSVTALNPDFLIGHDRITGNYAAALQQRHFPESRRILFIHTAPEEIELYEAGRPGATASAHAEKRVDLQRRLAAGCSLIVAVGSRLQREFETQMQGKPEVDRIVTFTPAVDTSEERPVNNPPGIQCLVLGRADHRILKGLDVAARSVGSIAARWTGPNRPKLVVRGAPVGAGDDLRAELIAESDCNQLEVIVREYSPQSEKIQEDFYRASVLLMPSRAEGFGLVGLEAISCGIPILITHESGLAEMLREYARIESEGWILPVGHDAEKSSPLWAAALCKILEDRAAAFEKARALRTKLEFAVSWDGEAQKLLARLRGAALQE